MKEPTKYVPPSYLTNYGEFIVPGTVKNVKKKVKIKPRKLKTSSGLRTKIDDKTNDTYFA